LGLIVSTQAGAGRPTRGRFERLLGRDLLLLLEPVDGGWKASVTGVRAKEEDSAGVVELPLRLNNTLELNAWHARVQAERNVLLWPQNHKPEAQERAMQFTARSACGEGRLVLSYVE
jgi:hypothetical protein